MKCCVCGAPVGMMQVKSYPVGIEGHRMAVCSEQCQDVARNEPSSCAITFETAVELTPL